MFQKIANVLSIISFVMVASMSGGAYFGYRYVTSENFKSQVMNEILANVQGMMPKVLDQGLPKMTGPSMPITQNECFWCDTELIWGADADIEEDFQPVLYQEYSMVTNFSCPKCDSYVEVYKRRDAYD